VLPLAQTVGFEPTWHCCQIDFESSTSRYSSYISLFRFALKRLFSVLTLVFDILTYFVLYVARGCLGNIWATIVFRATLLAQHRGNRKFVQNLKIWLYFSPNLFSLYGDFTVKNTNSAAESGAFVRKTRGYSVVQNEALFNDSLSMSAKGLYALIAARIDYTAVPLTKQWLMNHCTEGERAFNRAWDMLKNNGYLVAHVRPANRGRFCYEYELRDSNNGWNGVYLIYYDAQGNISNTNLTKANHTLQNVPTGMTTTHKTAPVVTTPVVSAVAVM
jgi:hypothetical protein